MEEERKWWGWGMSQETMGQQKGTKETAACTAGQAAHVRHLAMCDLCPAPGASGAKLSATPFDCCLLSNTGSFTEVAPGVLPWGC